MPQRQFWTHEYPTKIVFTFVLAADDPDADPTGVIEIRNQSGQLMKKQAGSIPVGFGAWAFADACRAGMEGWELGESDDAVRAFIRTLSQWRRDARAIYRKGGRPTR